MFIRNDNIKAIPHCLHCGGILSSENDPLHKCQVSKGWSNKQEKKKVTIPNGYCPDSIKKVTFKDLFTNFIAGTPIKRKVWRGYWVYKYGKIEIHAKDGTVINFLDTKDILFTLSGILQDDWEIATNENCDIPVN
jgi:hypothetical protein